MADEHEVLEIHLEEVGQHSWVKSLLNLLGGSYGSGQFRFVARPPGPDTGQANHVLGATFPVMRMSDLDDRRRPNAWIETAEERFAELDRQLVRDGWVRQPGEGHRWWSHTYRRDLGRPAR
jgi:hypothetical protein